MLMRSAAAGILLLASCTEPDRETSPTEPVAPIAHLVSSYDILKMPTPVTLDGDLSEWAGIPTIPFQDDPGNGRGALNNTATARMAWDANYLYVAYNITDTELWAVETTRDAANLHRDDEVEVYLDPQGDGGTSMQTTDYQFLANIRDAVKDVKGDGAGGKQSSFNAASLQSKAALNGSLNGGGTDVGYTMELRVAWSDLPGSSPVGGQFMLVDLAVGDKDSSAQSVVQSFDWAALPGTYNNPSGWRAVQLVDRNPAVPVYDMVKVPSTAIALDGDLSDWAGVQAIPTFADDPARGAAANTASVKLAWDNTYLYAAYNITDTQLWATETTRDATNIFKDDEVELYIDPQGDGGTFMNGDDYQLLANILETVKDVKGDGAGGKSSGFNAPSLQAQVGLNGTLGGAGTGYTLELRVAWSDLSYTPAPGNVTRLDLAVGDKDSGTQPVVESFDWAALPGTYNNPDGWKGVRLVVDGTAPDPPTSPQLTVVSSSEVKVSWTLSGSADVARYRVYRGSTLVATVAGSPYNDTGLSPSTTYSYQISAVDAAGNESAKTTAVSATTAGTGGIPYGPFALWSSYTATKWSPNWGPIPFTISMQVDAPNGVVTRINAARQMGQKLVLCLAGCAHAPVKTGSAFDLAKWKAAIDQYNTNPIRAAIDTAVTDGTVVGNNMMDEPENGDWGGVVTRPMVDQMATYAKQYFPTLPMGVNHGPTGYQWRTSERYTKLDYVVNQYNWWITNGNVAAWRDAVLTRSAVDGVQPAFSLNIINGGVQDTDGTWNCAVADGQSGHQGTSSPNCWMTATQVRNWGRTLGVAGCLMLMWTFDTDFMANTGNQGAFNDVAATLGATQAPSCRRPT
jgi:hypothetical protein